MSARELVRERIATHGFARASEGARIGARIPGEIPPGWVCDMKSLMLDPAWLNAYAELFWERFSGTEPFQVAGLETAGIPLVAAIVMKGVERGTPVNGFYLRKSRKRYDLMKRIEGRPDAHPVILVDDLVNTGGTIRKHMIELADAGINVSHVFTIISFRSPSSYDLSAPLDSLFELSDFGLATQSRTRDMPHEIFEIRWRHREERPSLNMVIQKSRPVFDDERVYFGTDDGVVKALSKTDGEVIWSHEIGRHPPGKGILSSPALYDGILYIGAYDGDVYALDAGSGAVRWRYRDADWVGSSPCVSARHSLIYIGLEFGLFRKRGGIVALRAADGTAAWSDRTPELTHGSPLYIEEHETVVIGSNDGVAYAYDARHGGRHWIAQTPSDIKVAPAYADDIVFVPSVDGTLSALDVRTGRLAWTFATGGLYSTPLVRHGIVYIASLDKCIYALDASSGTERSRFETRGRIFASPIFADEAIWIGSNDGRVYTLSPKTLALQGSHQFSERIVNALAYDEPTRTYFVPTVANELYCCKKK